MSEFSSEKRSNNWRLFTN